MREYKLRANSLLIVLLVMPALALMLGQKEERPFASKEVRGKQLPVVDFDAPEPNDAKARAKRREKARRYDRSSSQPIRDVPSMTGRAWSGHWARGIEALPVGRSDAVVLGWVTDAKAYLSNDKTGVYSEFSFQVEETLKSINSSLIPGTVICVERFGGSVRFRSGAVQEYITTGQGMPRVNAKYLLFLKRQEDDTFSIITGYEIGAAVWPLDGAIVEEGRGAYAFDKYQGYETSSFLQLVRSTTPH